jgi:hypothetical protein
MNAMAGKLLSPLPVKRRPVGEAMLSSVPTGSGMRVVGSTVQVKPLGDPKVAHTVARFGAG